MKRKDLEDLDDDLSFAYLASPSRKSRRLDVDLLPVIQEDPRNGAMPEVEQPVSSTSIIQSNGMPFSEEKAIVLYNPISTPLFKSPSEPGFSPLFKSPSEPGLSIVLNSDLIPTLKGHIFWPGSLKKLSPEGYEAVAVENNEASDNRMALVPWVAPQLVLSEMEASMTDLSDAMETEEAEAEMMDTEESLSVDDDASKVFELEKMVEGNRGLQTWQQEQQHFMPANLLQKRSTPAPW